MLRLKDQCSNFLFSIFLSFVSISRLRLQTYLHTLSFKILVLFIFLFQNTLVSEYSSFLKMDSHCFFSRIFL